MASVSSGSKKVEGARVPASAVAAGDLQCAAPTPSWLLFPRAIERQVVILARLPLSSGMLTGKLTRSTQFQAEDHRSFNREGAAFDRGETFSGFDYEKGLAVVEKLRSLLPEGMTLPELALRFIASFPAVTCRFRARGGRTKWNKRQAAGQAASRRSSCKS